MAITMVTTVGTMDTTMEEMDSAVLTQTLRRISPTSHTSSVRRLGTTPPLAQRTSQMMLQGYRLSFVEQSENQK
jgi:hypothetical protein